MSYEQALKEARRVGAGKCEGLPWLALTCEALSGGHAVNPKLAYEGARRKGLTASEVRKLDGVGLGDLMFA